MHKIKTKLGGKRVIVEESSGMIQNPLTPGILDMIANIKKLGFKDANAIPSVFMLIIYGIVFLALSALWPYGLLAVVSFFLWDKILEAREQMRDMILVQKMSYTLAIGIYFLLWTPFALACLPMVLIGWIGGLIAGKEKA